MRQPLILLIEDDPDDAELSKRFLNNAGCQVQWARSAEDGLVMMQRIRNWDAVITDIKMPGIGGHGLLEEMRSRHIIAVLMVMSSSNYVKDVQLAYEAGATIYCEKPIDLHEWEHILHLFIQLFFNPWIKPRQNY